MADSNSRLVYSTQTDNICPNCSKPLKKCKCQSTTHSKKTTDGIVRVSLEKKGRKGKGVTLISGLPLDTTEIKSLAKQLKQKCGSGGTVKNGIIEIQGDHRAAMVSELSGHGYTVKKSGG